MRGNLGSKCRLCRAEGIKLFLKGERCLSPSCPLERKGAVRPGIHGPKGGKRLSPSGEQLREKQKLKRIYGVSERQMKNYWGKAARKKVARGETLLSFLERRLDNVLYKAGFVSSRNLGRQLIAHGMVRVDERKVTVPSYQLEKGQVVNFTPKALEMVIVKETLAKKITPPSWILKKAAVLKIASFPKREDTEGIINEQLIIEFYSR